MSFQSIDSDEFAVFSSGSCSPEANPLHSSFEDDTSRRRNSTPQLSNDGSVYQTVLMSDDVSKGDTSKVEHSIKMNSLQSSGWTLNDFIMTNTSSSLPSRLSLETVTPAPVPSHSRAANWDTVGTITVPVNVTYNVLRSSSAQNVSLSDASNILHDDDHFSDAYNRVSFDSPQPRNRNLFPQAAAHDVKNEFDLSPLPTVSKSKKTNLDGIQNINSQCFEAAVREHFGHRKHSKGGHYTSKLKHCKPHTRTAHIYDKLQRISAKQSPTQHKTFVDSPVASQALGSGNVSKDSLTKTTFSTFTIPSIPSPLSPFSASTHSPLPADGRKSPKGETDIKKYRYNQTALALQQSGLMKTTIKTAELLRKSRLLQQELSKLRKETSVFVHMVLNNPENKHIKDMYMSQQKDNSDCE